MRTPVLLVLLALSCSAPQTGATCTPAAGPNEFCAELVPGAPCSPTLAAQAELMARSCAPTASVIIKATTCGALRASSTDYYTTLGLYNECWYADGGLVGTVYRSDIVPYPVSGTRGVGCAWETTCTCASDAGCRDGG